MSEHSEISQSEIDRLVDGELSEGEQQSLLGRVDETDSWKQLALSYMEAQAWGVELGEMASFSPAPSDSRSSVTGSSGIDSKETSRIQSRSQTPGWLTVILAASIMLVLGLLAGLELQTGSDTDSPDGLAESTQTRGLEKEQPGPVFVNDQAPLNPELAPDPQVVELVFDSPWGQAQMVSVPLEDDVDPQSVLTSTESVFHPGAIDFLRQRGHELREEQNLIQLELPDGRHAVVPVRQVDFQHMMNRFGQ